MLRPSRAGKLGTLKMPKPVHTPLPTLDRDNYAPIFLSSISNKYSRGASRQYLRLYGIGIIECRILAVLAWKPDMTANEICTVLDVDKAAVSRSLRVLQTRDFVTLTRNAARRRTICLTEKGADLHAKAMVIGQRREHALLKGFSTAERAHLMGFLHRLLDNATEMNAQEFSPDVDDDIQGNAPRGETAIS
jgi:DNA-binding MarR family transcriptional regulator